MPHILITGSNRGIGLELATQYARDNWRVYATCRHPAEAEALQALASSHENVSVHRLDVTLIEDIRAVQRKLEGVSLDLLFNNAGVYLEDSYSSPEPGNIEYSVWLRTLDINSLGPVRVSEAFIDQLSRSEKPLIAVMTSHMGSIADIDTGGSYYYRSSKATLNAAMKGLANALRPEGIGVLLIHPGGVATRMGPSNGISTSQSVEGLRNQIDDFSMDKSGTFISYDGTPMPW